VNSDLFNDVEDFKKQVTALTTSYLTTKLNSNIGTNISQHQITE
jgi:hypothetical protein